MVHARLLALAALACLVLLVAPARAQAGERHAYVEPDAKALPGVPPGNIPLGWDSAGMYLSFDPARMIPEVSISAWSLPRPNPTARAETRPAIISSSGLCRPDIPGNIGQDPNWGKEPRPLPDPNWGPRGDAPPFTPSAPGDFDAIMAGWSLHELLSGDRIIDPLGSGSESVTPDPGFNPSPMDPGCGSFEL